MALRIKSHWWNDDQERSLPEIASALAFIAWRIAVDKAINLHCERFLYESDRQRLDVIEEYLVFLIQIADRMSHGILEDENRRTLITAFAKKVFEHVQDNTQDLLGPGDYGGPFIARLNTRSGEYADYRFDDEGPSYAFLRHLGFEIQSLMGPGEENRWVIDQVMDKDGWDAYKRFSKAFRDLFE
ncbi:hypothetical protein [Thiocapsa bogorovii]|uniref:hypothetical protein n=1 Tax=Thiocapsa bogorovii TaxID=521689 RepID=UPI001E3A33AE|nr:hypothetical protein [Thiocapsa bogorovii]UHD16799.1 hypothetical protein LT988_01675 [Thiocapsa bogorovii]